VGRKCLCNGLAADAGFPQTQKNGYTELPLVTSGDEVVHVAKFLKDGEDSYTAADVIEQLLAGVPA
jgi:nitronate monooxygenase